MQVSADEGAGELPDDLKTCIYRVVQEALHNCARHAQARSVKVVVEQEEQKHRADRGGRRRAASTPAACAAWAWWAWRSASLIWEDVSRCAPRPARGTRVAVELPLAS